MSTTDIEFTPEEELQLLRKQKAQFERLRHRFRFRWGLAPVLAIIGAAGGFFLGRIEGESLSASFLYALVGALPLTGLYSLLVLYIRFILRIAERRIDLQLLKAGAADLQATIEEDFVTKLIKINFKYIDQYYEQTQSQANKSFFLSAFASLVGLAIISTGIVMMFLEMTEPAYVTAAAGIASEFIAAVFFYLYNRTITKMADYHNKLVVTQNVSLALKIADELSDTAREEAHRQLIDRLTENVNLYLTQQPSSSN